MTILENLPPEVWANILDFACLDDGTTARSLSLVSRQTRHLSRNHLYYAVKVDSVSQLLKLEDQISISIPDSMKDNGYLLKTRFLCITLPTPFILEVYPEESYAPERIPGDTPYRPRKGGSDSDDNSWYATDLSDAESDNGSPHEQEEQSLEEELESELADITNDPARENLGPGVLVSSLSDLLTHPHYSMDRFLYRVYCALRKVLDACANTLEVFSLYFNPSRFIPPDLFVPPLPKLQRLSIYIRQSKDWIHVRRTQPGPSLLFPSLKTLRMVDSFSVWFKGMRVKWWADVVKSSPPNIRVITGNEVPRYVSLCSNSSEPGRSSADITYRSAAWELALKEQNNVKYQVLTATTIDCIVRMRRGPKVAVQWWLDDMDEGNVVLHTDIAGKSGRPLHDSKPIPLN
jgi:hypothetical protein